MVTQVVDLEVWMALLGCGESIRRQEASGVHQLSPSDQFVVARNIKVPRREPVISLRNKRFSEEFKGEISRVASFTRAVLGRRQAGFDIDCTHWEALRRRRRSLRGGGVRMGRCC